MTSQGVWASPTQLEQEIWRVCQQVGDAIRNLLSKLEPGPMRPQALARRLNLNKSLASRICRLARAADPLAAAHLMPGPEALRMLLAAAERQVAEPGLTAALAEAIVAFEKLIQRELGDRAGLDAVLSEAVPDAREKFELTNRQAAFRAMANLKGVRAEVLLNTIFVHPGDDPEALDSAALFGLLKLRRLRPTALVQLYSEHLDPSGDRVVRLTLDGRPVEGVEGLLLREHCSEPLPGIEVRRDGRRITYLVTGNGLGLSSAVDLVFAEYHRGRFRRYRSGGGWRTAGTAAVIDQPVTALVFDMFVHEQAWAGAVPELHVYDTVIRGTAHPEDISRDIDRLDLLESIRPLGRGVRRARVAEVPRYLEMLEQVCRALSWDPEAFRGYRCYMRYPIYGSQVCMVFALPPSPQAGSRT